MRQRHLAMCCELRQRKAPIQALRHVVGPLPHGWVREKHDPAHALELRR